MHNQLLTKWGWNEHFQTAFLPYQAQELMPGRVLFVSRESYTIATAAGECQAGLAGSLQYILVEKSAWPVVGDWVAVTPVCDRTASSAVIQAVLPRQTKLSRQAPGRITEEQVLAANLDFVWLVSGLDRDFNPRRIERYLAMARSSGAAPVLVLNKADLVAELAEYINHVSALAPGVPVYCTTFKDPASLKALAGCLKPGITAAMVGSSGVGKSTLLNLLIGQDKQEVREVREDDQRGRHTTTSRKLFSLPGGGLIIDTPGLREIQLWSSDGSLDLGFEDIARWEARCRFRDCRHEGEPGCAVQEALLAGEIPEERYLSFLKLKREQTYQNRRQDEKQYGGLKAEQKKLARLIRTYNKHRHKDA